MTVAAPTAPAAAPAPTAVAATPVGDVVGRPIGVAVREARREEYSAIEDAIVAAYRASMEVSEEYEADMRRLAEHAASYRVWVAVDDRDDVLGTVLTPPAPTPPTQATSRRESAPSAS